MTAIKKSEAHKRNAKSPALAAALEAAQDMADAGLIDKKTLRDYETLCLKVPELSAGEVLRIRTESKTSQGYFARVLNVSASTVKQWESGAKRPSGLAAKVLMLIDRRGLQFLIEDPQNETHSHV